MRYTPVELRHVRLGKSLFRGYKQDEIDKLLEDVADSFEDVWRERGELADKLEDVEKVLAEVKQREQLLTSALVSAERAAADARAQAKREAEVIVAEAHQEARSITRSAQAERERLFAEVRRMETLMRAALGMVEEANAHVGEGAGGEGQESWPKRQDTREFAAAELEQPSGPESLEAEHAEDDRVEAEATPLPPVQTVPDDAEPADGGGAWAGRDFAWG
jgi:cell division initiation protein